MEDKRKIVIFGISDMSELAFYYFENDSPYKVVAFTIDQEYITTDHFCNQPVVPFDQVNALYPPSLFDMFIAVGYSKVNKIRKHIYETAKEKGYQLVNYISSKATILSKDIGDNVFLLEDNTIQPFTKIGNNVVLWSGNHLGHHSTINDHCFISSHVVISGRVTIGSCSFIGVNATLRDHIKIGESCVIGAGCLILEDVADHSLYIGTKNVKAEISSQQLKKI
jgi:sugar O-acyltransferase (sialic acid O-acetyltransferase NeuD family)